MMKKRVIVATIILINSIISLYPQQTENYLEIRGRAELDMQPLNGAVITLYEGNTKINSVKTGSDGIFSFKLEINKYYVVEVGKDKYISKRLAFDTSLPEEEKGVWVREFAMSVVKSCDGVNYSALTDPVDVIKYNAKRKDFESDNAHLSKMRSKLEGIMMDNEQCLEDKYDKLIKEADRAMANKQFDEAREKYAAASEIFPDKEYPKQKSSQINQQISKLENIENLYTKTIGEADALLAQNKTDEALLKFKAASILKPQESYPKQKAGEIEQLIAKAQANQQVASAQEAKYNNTIARANAEMTAKNFEAAKQLYQQALQVKPGDQLAQAKIAEAERAAVSHQQQVADRNKQTETENEYQQVLAQADNLFKNKDYKAALEQFNKALSLKPNEAYPKQRVNQLNSSIAAEEAGKQREINAGYQNAMTAAEKSSSAKDFQSAKNYYQQALQFKPDDAALRSKLAEMDRLMAQDAQNKQQQEETRRQYLALVQKADQLYAAKNLESAKEAYQEAGSRKPDEQYPLQRIQEIDRQIFADKAKEQQKIQENYQNAVNTGNTLLTQKQHQRAKEAFQQALAIKPGDVFAQNKINETDNLLRQEQAQQTALQAKKTQYDGIITNADKFFASKDFTAAKSEYLKATQVLPDEQYPKQRVQEIDRLSTLAEAEKQRELEAKFMAAFNTGNNYMTQKSYTNAISSFEEALTYKPGDINVKNRLAEA
ncbi:MAG: SpaA isopeptide-forming pilin-related protein, partial [Bacteroidales bacterium]